MFRTYPEVGKNGELLLTPTQLVARKQYLLGLKEGTKLVDDLRVDRPAKSNKQLGDFWGLFCPIVLDKFDEWGWDSSILLNLPKHAKVIENTGTKCTKVMLKEYMYAVCPMENEEGERITMSDSDTASMANFQTACRDFAAAEWHINVPEPDPQYKEKKK